MKNKFISLSVSLILSVAVILGLMLVPAALPAVPAGVALANGLTCGFEIQPSTSKVGFDKNFTVNATVTDPNGTAMWGWSMYLIFDPNMLECTGVDTPASLPGGATPDLNPRCPDELPYQDENGTPILLPWWNNTQGIVHNGYSTPGAKPSVSFNFSAIHFKSKSVAGTTYLNLTIVDTSHCTEVLDAEGNDLMNGAMVVNGTVIIGVPQLSFNISPSLHYGPPPGNFTAMGGAGIGFNITWEDSVPISWEFMPIFPYQPLPSITNWTWGEILIPAAAQFVPGWTFKNWTPEPASPLPPDNITYMNMTIPIWPQVVQMNDLLTNITANFQQKLPAIYVTPASLSFVTNQNVTPSPKGFFMVNSGGGTLNWSATTDQPWLSVLPTSGSLIMDWYEQDNVTVGVFVNVTGMNWSAVKYLGNITITGASSKVIPVDLTINPATAIKVCRTIGGTTNSGLPNETVETYPGETFTVSVNFTAPVTNFNAIGLTDTAPNGWTVTVNKNWCTFNGTPASAYSVLATGNKAEIMWSTIPKDTVVVAWYNVTVPTTASAGLNYFGDCDMSRGWIEYYFGVEGPHTSCISCCDGCGIMITVPGDIVGETFDVNHNQLPTTDVALYLTGAGWLRSDVSTPFYLDKAYVKGEYWLVANKTNYYDIDVSTIIHIPFTLNLTDEATLAAGKVFNFTANYGLVPKSCTMAYVQKSVNLWIMSPSYPLDMGLSAWKVDYVIHSWQFPYHPAP